MIQSLLKRAGYRTGAFGKFLNTWSVSTDPPSFDKWAVTPHSELAYRNGTWNVDGEIRKVTKFGPSFMRDRAMDFIRESESDVRPWFAYVATPAPHAPYEVKRRHRRIRVGSWPGSPSTFEDDVEVDPAGRADKPSYVRDRNRSYADGVRVRRKQLRSLLQVDQMMRSFERLLRRTGEDKNTLVIFISDNGFLWGQHGLTAKFVPYAEAVRVPAYVRWPARIAPGSVDERLVSTVDLTPTLLHAAGIDPDQRFPLDGRSLLDMSWQREKVLIEAWSQHRYPTWAGFFGEEHSYVEYYEDDGLDSDFAEREFYDLIADPYQLHNLFGDDDVLNDPLEVTLWTTELREARSCSGPAECP